jgi:hypothetical protein
MSSWCKNLRAAWALMIVASSLTSAACGYALAGQGNFLPSNIRTIGIPTFTNQTSYFDIAQISTDKVRTEFIGRGKYKVVPEATGADAVLNGVITGITIVPSAFGTNQQASRYVITVTANIELRDTQKNAVLWSNPSVAVREEYDAGSSSAAGAVIDASAFFVQEAGAVQRITDEFARTVVSSILEAF